MPKLSERTLRILLISAIAVVAVAVVAGGAVLVANSGSKTKTDVYTSKYKETTATLETSASPSRFDTETIASLEASASAESSSTTGTTPIDKSKVYVPNVTQLSYKEAARLTKLAGLEPVQKVVSGKVDKDAGAPNIVYRVTPSPGSHVKRGTKIELRYYTK